MNYRRYVVDTSALNSYFAKIIGANVAISVKSMMLIDEAFNSLDIILIFPVVSILEMFKKFAVSEEIQAKMKAEIFDNILSRDNMEIRAFDNEILECFNTIIDIDKKYNFDNHDKQILATAMALNSPLITSDGPIAKYNRKKNVIPAIFK